MKAADTLCLLRLTPSPPGGVGGGGGSDANAPFLKNTPLPNTLAFARAFDLPLKGGGEERENASRGHPSPARGEGKRAQR
jgi:hypothetical protein